MPRPRAIQGEVEKRLLEALRSGLTVRLACEYAGVTGTTYHEEVNRNPEFAESVTRARLAHLPQALDDIRKAGTEDWRALAKWVELVFPNDYGRRIEVSGPGGAPVKVEVEDARERLLREYDRLAERQRATGSGSGEPDV